MNDVIKGALGTLAAVAVFGGGVWYFALGRDWAETAEFGTWSGTKAKPLAQCELAGPEVRTTSIFGPETVGATTALIGTTLVSNLVKAGYAALQQYLEDQEERFSAVSTARFVGHLFSWNPLNHHYTATYRCLSVVRGTFGMTDGTTATDDWSAERLTQYGLVEPPEFYAEFRLLYSDPVLEIVPAYLDYRATAADRGRHGEKGIIITINLRSISAEGEEGVLYTLSLPNLRIGSRLTEPTLVGLTAGGQPLLPAPEGEDEPNVFEGLVTITETGTAPVAFDVLRAALTDTEDTVTTETDNLIRELLGAIGDGQNQTPLVDGEGVPAPAGGGG